MKKRLYLNFKNCFKTIFVQFTFNVNLKQLLKIFSKINTSLNSLIRRKIILVLQEIHNCFHV